MELFPTLTAKFQSFPESPVDDTISSQSEAGYQQTRPRFTRYIRIFGPIKMVVNRTDRDALIAFDKVVKSSVVFSVSHPTTGDSLVVRFKKDGRLKIEPILDSNPLNKQFTAEFSFEEA